MRKVLAALTVISAALVVTPAPASAAPPSEATRVDAPARLGDVATLIQRVVTITNNKRSNRGCRALRVNAALTTAAQTHTDRMAQRGSGGTLSHQLPGEPDPGTRISDAGYEWREWGENVAAGQTTARAVVRSWMRSAGHRRNILKCSFRHIGVGLAYATDGTPYWTQVFGRR